MTRRAWPGTLMAATVWVVGLLALTALTAVAASRPSGQRRMCHVMLPLVTRQFATASKLPDVHVSAALSDGTPLPGARITGIYSMAGNRTYIVQRVTDDAGHATLPGSRRDIVIEVQYPAGFLPCPDSPPRTLAPPGTAQVKFVACQTQPSDTP